MEQHQLGLLEKPLPQGTAPALRALDKAQRAEVVAALARLIVKVAAGHETESAADVEENRDE